MKFFLLLLFILGSNYSQGQITFQKNYSDLSSIMYVSETPDGGYIFSGGEDDTIWAHSTYLIKTDQYGDPVWSKYYKNIEGVSTKKTSDGGYIIAGLKDGIILTKIDSAGNLQWTKQYYYDLSTGSGTWDHAISVAPTFDGGYILSGSVFYIGPMYSDAFLIKTDSVGDTLWTRIYNYAYQDGISVIETHDSCYLMTTDGFVNYKVDRNGDTLWTKHITSSYQLVKDAIECNDHGFAFTGRCSGGIFLLKTDSLCNPLWAKAFKAFDESSPGNIHETLDGGFIIGGIAVLHDSINYNFFHAIRTDSNGDTLWTKSFDNRSFITYIDQVSDSGFIAAGYASNESSLMKMDVEGNMFCNDSPIATTVTTPAFQTTHLPISIVESRFYYISLALSDSSGINDTTICFSINDEVPITKDKQLAISISPNPFHSEAKLEVGNRELGNSILKIFNPLGILLREEKISDLNSYILHRDGLNDGLYFFQLSTLNSQLIGSGKFVVE